jgi:endonuclease/exonuclease/phosphatase family metal-dependent hydrolase
VQEALPVQMSYLQEKLSAYAHVGVGREDGDRRGEHAAIFYRLQGYRCLQAETFWLSETPDVAGSLGWDAHNDRICTWGRFEAVDAGVTFCFFNTHLDHRGQEAQTEGARLLMQRIERVADGQPVILTGDFNCTPNSPPYRVLTGGDPAVQDLHLADACLLSQTPPAGPAWTFHGFNPPGSITIDYIFVKNVAAVRAFQTLDDHWNGHYPSDHLPVMATVDLPARA